MAKSPLSKIDTKVIEALQSSPMLLALALDPHQLMIASRYMMQDGVKSIEKAHSECILHCPPGYKVEEDTKLTLFLSEYELMVRGAHLFSMHVLYAEAYRQYLKAVAGADHKGQAYWFEQLTKLAPKIGATEEKKKRRISV